ncbi:MAG: DUF177 domain-containing protein [Flavobacteriales bacterium]
MDPLKEYDIPFTGLKDGEHEFQFELGQAFFEATGEEEFEGGRVQATVKLDKSATMLVTNIHMEGPVALRCDHCDGPLEFMLKGDQRQIFRLTDQEEYDDDELVSVDPHAHSVNLTHYLYECLRLAVPARHVHATGQCDPEVEQALGRLAIEHEPVPDPRWEALEQLKNKRP